MTTDYSQFHKPINDDLIPSNSDGSYCLSESEVAFFRDNGFVIGKGSIDQDLISELLSDLESLLVPGHDGEELWHEYHTNESTVPDTILFHALGAWRIRASFHDLLWHPAITAPARQLLGAAVRFWHDQLFCKPAHHGGVVAWHQDYSYWTRTAPLNHLTCWIALEDASVENGCLHYIPGSHQWELLPVTGLAGDMNSIQELLDAEQMEAFRNPVPVELKAGQVVFHHALTVHGSFENRTDRSRKAVVVNLIGDGVASKSNEPLLKGVPPINPGTPLKGQFFPLLQR